MANRLRFIGMLASSLITLLSLPLWYFATIAILSAQTDDLNTVAVQAYFGITVLLALPASCFAGFAVGPCVAWLFSGRPALSVALPVFALLLFGSLNFIGASFFAILPEAAGWLLLPYNVTALIGPPIAIGAIGYTYFLNQRLPRVLGRG